jgi:hydrogenase/urease accessory protein HupE
MARIPQTTRARFQPGPLLATLVTLLLSASTVRAHDPGLSALDVVVGGETITVSLSMASADVALVAPDGNTDSRRALTSLAREAIRVSLDGDALSSIDEGVSVGTSGARVRMTFAVRAPRDRAGQLIIASDVPKRLARGHRELLIIYVDDAIAAEKLLDERSDSLTVDLRRTSAAAPATAWSFLKLGNQHILSGYDHLLFLAGLFLAAATAAQLVALLTAFTVAHSISLALVVLAGVHLPASIVEPLIAASIAWVGVENLIGAKHRRRWLVVFGFGLIHGFGFAGALTDLGLGSTTKDVAKALFFFNAGVESGQLLVAAAILPLLWAIRSRSLWPTKLRPLCSALIVMAGGYWLFARLM